MKRPLLSFAIIAASLSLLAAAGCSGKPADSGLRDSFAAQFSTNKVVKDFQRNGDDLTFTGPGLEERGEAKWRVHIDSTSVEETGDQRAPYKGIVKSTWYADGKPIQPSGRDSNLPIALSSTVAQECWGLWDPNKKEWGW